MAEYVITSLDKEKIRWNENYARGIAVTYTKPVMKQ